MQYGCCGSCRGIVTVYPSLSFAFSVASPRIFRVSMGYSRAACCRLAVI